MKKICCLLLLVMLCMSTTYAAKGKECIKYLCGVWGIPGGTDVMLYFDNVGALSFSEDYKGSTLNQPVIRYKYGNIDEVSYIDEKTGKGIISMTDNDGKAEYFFDNFKQMRVKDHFFGYGKFTTYVKVSDTVNLYGKKIIDYDSFVEPILNEGTYFYTPEKGAEQLKVVISKNSSRKRNINVYNKENKLLFQYNFYEDAYPTIRKIHYRSGKSDLVCYSHVGTGNYLHEFFIIGKTASGFGKVYDIGKNMERIGSGARVWYEYDSIHLQGTNGYNGADGRGLKRNPEVVIIPAMQSGKGYTYKMLSLEDFYKYKAAKSKSSKPVL